MMTEGERQALEERIQAIRERWEGASAPVYDTPRDRALGLVLADLKGLLCVLATERAEIDALRAQVETLRQERDGYQRGCREWNAKFETWRAECEARAKAAESQVAQLTKLLQSEALFAAWEEATVDAAVFAKERDALRAQVAQLTREREEWYERGRMEALQHLASAMKKTLAPESVNSLVAALSPETKEPTDEGH